MSYAFSLKVKEKTTERKNYMGSLSMRKSWTFYEKVTELRFTSYTTS